MLVLSRGRGQAIQIGDQVLLKVLKVDRNGGVRLGIEAPRDLSVLRGELIPPTTDQVRSKRADEVSMAGGASCR